MYFPDGKKLMGLWVADDFVKAGADALIGLEIIPQGGAEMRIRPFYFAPASINKRPKGFSEEESLPGLLVSVETFNVMLLFR